jgi:hypothetical protein
MQAAFDNGGRLSFLAVGDFAAWRGCQEKWNALLRGFFRLNGHHLLRHRYMGKNFNVVLPLADLLLGTLPLRSPIQFKQARGPSVPDVQPRVKLLRIVKV